MIVTRSISCSAVARIDRRDDMTVVVFVAVVGLSVSKRSLHKGRPCEARHESRRPFRDTNSSMQARRPSTSFDRSGESPLRSSSHLPAGNRSDIIVVVVVFALIVVCSECSLL
jgi:hypothetical protein